MNRFSRARATLSVSLLALALIAGASWAATVEPLNIIFIRADGRIAYIAENTTPHSEAIISSRMPVRGVLEVVAGTAKKLGIQPGDKVAHHWFAGR